MRSRISKTLIVAALLLLAPIAEAQRADVPQEAGVVELDRSQATEAALGTFVCGGCSTGWVWTKVQEAWRYESGSEERIWVYMHSSYSGSYAVTSTADARARMFIEAASSFHWVGLYYAGSSTFSNVRLWYN